MNYIIDNEYFPDYTLFKRLGHNSNCIIEQYVPYRKLSFSNRCTLPGANGLINLSVPLQKGRDQKTLLKEVRIANLDPWQARHWKTITACYNRSPWFDYFRDGLETLYKKKMDFLVDWNQECFIWASENLSLNLQISFTESFQATYPSDTHTDLRTRSNTVGRNQQMSPGDQYTQVFEERLGFISGLSVIDRIFCDGVKGWLKS